MNGMTYCFKPIQERSSCSFRGRKNMQCPGSEPYMVQNKKAHPINQMSLQYDGLIISKLDSDLSASPSWRDGIGTFL